MDLIALAQKLVSFPTVSPDTKALHDFLIEYLKGLGFSIQELVFKNSAGADVHNLVASIGQGPALCFSGHIDVVPIGERSNWICDPFGGEIIDNILYGRGIIDMKGAVACFIDACSKALPTLDLKKNSLMLAITGDEEIGSSGGARQVTEYLKKNPADIKLIVVGEPSNPEFIGEVVRVGRRGILHLRIKVTGKSGHTAYAHLADNAAHKLVRALQEVISAPLDSGSPNFSPSALEITNLTVNNFADNVIPGLVFGEVDIRFNDLHTPESLIKEISSRIERVTSDFSIEIVTNDDHFLTAPSAATKLVIDTIKQQTGHEPRLDTGGGTSDARFLKDIAPVIEFGLISATIHKDNECIKLSELRQVSEIYQAIITNFCKQPW